MLSGTIVLSVLGSLVLLGIDLSGVNPRSLLEGGFLFYAYYTLLAYIYTLFTLSGIMSGIGGSIVLSEGNEDVSENKKDEGEKQESSVNQMEQEVRRGQAPETVERVDRGKILGEKPHVHFKDGNALNKDGTWKHGSKRVLSNKEKTWLKNHRWEIPNE